MNKQFFSIIVLALACQLHGMERDHNYQCNRHTHVGPYPCKVEMNRIGKAMNAYREWNSVAVYEDEDREFDAFDDGDGALTIALRAFEQKQPQKLARLNQLLMQSLPQFRRMVGRPLKNGGLVDTRDNTNLYWQNLNNGLANPSSGHIAWWENVIKESLHTKELEKIAILGNIFGSKKPDYFKNSLVTVFAHGLHSIFLAQATLHDKENAEKDAAISVERAAKEAAQRTLNEKQQADNANAAALRNLEANKETYLRNMREKLGQLFDASQTPPQRYQMENAGWAQNIANRLNNPTPQDIQNGIQLLQDENSHNLCELIIKTSQVNPQNAKALILTVISHVRDATVQAYACPLLEKLNKANANLTQAQEQQRKTQADLEAAQKAKTDAESTVTSIRNAKEAQKTSFDTEIRNIERQQNQRNESARRMLGDLQREISPLRRELPTLRTRVREQDIEIQALRRAITPQNQQ